MLGLFMLSPVLALYANQLPGATPLMVGLTLGIYGLTQATLQIPFGALSDRIGRKPVIAAGLVIFTAGSAIAAFAHHIVPILIGRAVQGAGAVSGATLALAADLTREEQRTKVMRERNVIRREAEWHAHVDATIQEVVDNLETRERLAAAGLQRVSRDPWAEVGLRAADVLTRLSGIEAAASKRSLDNPDT